MTVLNCNWQAINTRTPQDAFCQMATNVATALDIELNVPRAPKELPVTAHLRNFHGVAEWKLFLNESNHGGASVKARSPLGQTDKLETMQSDKMDVDTVDGLSSAGLLNGAEEYLEAALLVHRNQDPNQSLLSPIYFLVCQSVELALKAYLRGKGKTEDYLVKRIGHDLMAALDAAEAEGFSKVVRIEAVELQALTSINTYYSSKDLQYALSYYFKSYPAFETLFALAEKLILGLESFCLEKCTLHDGRPTAVVTWRGKRKPNNP